MAKAKIEGNIPGIGDITVTGNLATEDAMQDLISAVQGQAKSQKVSTDELQNNLDDASNGLDEFSDELSTAARSQDRLNKRMIDLTDRTESITKGFLNTTRSTSSMSDMVESAGEIVSGLAGGLAGLVPFIGEGTARLAEAATQAGFALLGMAVGAIESFQSLNRSIMDSGTLLDGGFSGFAAAANEAGMPITAFGEAILANTNRLRLMAGGAPGGLAKLAGGFRALNEATDENMEQLYALGFNQTEVAAGMANVAIAAQRAGRNLNNEQLAAGTFDYLRNLRELSRLTGVSAEEAMAQVEANRANLFVQNQLMDLAPAQRAAAEDFVAAMERSGLGPLSDFAMTGQFLNQETALMATRMGPLADIMRQYFLDLESGADPESAMERFNRNVAINEDAINTAIQENARTFGLTRELAEQFSFLGEGGLSIQRMIEAVDQGTDPLGGVGETSENLSITMGSLQKAVSDSQTAIQSTFVDGLSALSGDEGLLTAFARSVSGAAGIADDFGEALIEVMRGDFAAAARRMGIDPERPRTLPPENYVDPAAEEAAEQGMPLGAATGEIFTGPVSGYTAELHGTEAVVPLPDGRTIPVSFTSDGLTNMITDALAPALLPTAETVSPTVQSFAASLDNSRSLPELVNISRNMLGQMTASTQKLEQMIRAIEQSNSINRNAAYARA